MASSSVSQESLDIDDIEISNRQSRVRRARGAMMPRIGDRGVDSCDRRDWNGDHTGDDGVIPEHESPSRTVPSSRTRDKRNRPNHLHKGKLPKDKRKLREKRRSTGVVNLQSTESTGDSLDDEDDIDTSIETKRNTTCNEVIDADNPQTPSDSRLPKTFAARRTKSPSDLEADLEDNQDYDSAVSQSETNLTLIGKSDSIEHNPPTVSSLHSRGRGPTATRYSPDTPKSFKAYSPTTSDHDSKTSSISSSSSSSSVLNRYRWREQEHASPYKEKDSDATIRPIASIISQYDRKNSESDNTSSSNFSSASYRNYRDRFGGRDYIGSSKPGLSSIGHSNQHTYGSQNARKEDQEKINLQRMLEKEREENRKLKQMLDEKDKKIADLEREVEMLNKDLEDMDVEAQKLQIENSALIRAVSQLSTSV